MATDPVRGPLHHLEVGNARYGYHQFGQGPDIVLLNGDAMCMSLWTDTFLGHLSESLTVTVFDYPGMGRSVAPPGQSWLISDMATHTAAFIEALNIHRPAVLGWSTGGQIVLQMLVNGGDAFSCAVCVAADPGSDHYVGDRNILTELAAASPSQSLAYLFPDDQHSAVEAFVNDIMARPQDDPTPQVLDAQNEAFGHWLNDGVWDALGTVATPLLVITGDSDKAVDSENSRNIASRVAGAELWVVADAGHGVVLQQPEQAAARIGAFVAAHT